MRVKRTYGERCVVVGQWGPSLTGVARYTKQCYLIFMSGFLLRGTDRKPNTNYLYNTYMDLSASSCFYLTLS